MLKNKQQMQGQQQNEYTFRIGTDKLQAEFQCTVCLNPINDCYITRCGHVYCKACIEQTINRHHKCPFCNQELKDFKQDVFKNYHFNTLKKIIDDQKRKENDKYLNKMFKRFQNEHGDVEGQNQLMKPIEEAIVKHCEDALLKYREHVLSIYELMKETEVRKLLMGISTVNTNSQLVESLHKLILNNLPSPIISPELITHSTTIEVLLPGSKVHRSKLQLSALSPFAVILPHLQHICSQMNVRINGKIPEVLTINGQKRKMIEAICELSGGKIVVADLPFQINVYCYSYNWEKNKATNFYSCKQCNVKWICESCSLLCHDGHPIVLQLKEHKADWACCYCVTKCICKALNKNSQIKS